MVNAGREIPRRSAYLSTVPTNGTMTRHRFLLALPLLAPALLAAQRAPRVFTHADTLRGSNGPGRAWWDATFYDLHVSVNPADSSIRGVNAITYRVLKPARQMQVDLQVPLVIDSIVQGGKQLTFRRDSNAFFVAMQAPQRTGSTNTLTVYYHGRPRVAKRPPWDGGNTWQRDSLGNDWIATTDEGPLGLMEPMVPISPISPIGPGV